MNLDKFTFGKTPAAIYLAHRLNELNDPKYTRKISADIHRMQGLFVEVIEAHDAGFLSIKSLSFFMNNARRSIKDKADDYLSQALYVGSGGHQMPDRLSVDLMSNVLLGPITSVFRRSIKVASLKAQQQHLKDEDCTHFLPSNDGKHAIATVKHSIIKKKITVGSISDLTTPEVLIERSKNKLAKLNKVNTLYE
jgi:hypothetical protein